MLFARIALLLTAVAAGAAFLVSLPDIIRYVRMRSM